MTDGPVKTRSLLLDIEGTVTPISFVHEILFPFARTHARRFLTQHSNTTDVQDDVASLFRERVLDVERGEQLSDVEEADWSTDAVVGYVNWLIDRDRKSPALKSLQGKIWKQGYLDGALQAPLFEDVVPNLRRLRSQGMGVSIFSSGSVLAQKLLFAHTQAGDLTDLIDQYFDTAVGSKGDSESYRRIAEALAVPAPQIVFVSDVASELKAAYASGMQTLLCVRPGNQPQSNMEEFATIHTFTEILPLG